jgi:hypothetical protein
MVTVKDAAAPVAAPASQKRPASSAKHHPGVRGAFGFRVIAKRSNIQFTSSNICQ